MRGRTAGMVFALTISVLGQTPRLPAQDPQKVQEVLQLRVQMQKELNELRYADAERSALRMKALSDEAFADQPLLQAAVLTNVGVTYDALFKLDEAEKIYQQVLRDFEAGGDAGAIGVVVTLSNLATTHQKQGRPEDSERLLRRAIDLARNTNLPGREFFLAKGLSNLGILLSLEGRSREAELCILEAVALFQKSGPVTAVPSDAEIMICLSTLDRIYGEQKRPVEAAAIRRELVKLLDRVYGADNFQTGQALFQMAQSEISQNRPEEGLPMMQRTLAIAERADPTSIFVGKCLLWIGTAELASGHLDESLKYLTRADTIYKQQTRLTPETQQERGYIAAAINSFPLLKMKANKKQPDLDQAITGAAKALGTAFAGSAVALSAAESTYGKNDPRILLDLIGLAEILTTIGQNKQARELIDRGFAIREKNERAAADYDKNLYDLRSRVEWVDGQRTAAIADLRKALDAIQAFLQQAIGSEIDRARFGNMDVYLEPFERMVGWCSETGDIEAGFLAADQSRSRILFEQLNRSVDPMAAIPRERREELLNRKTRAFARSTQLENQILALDFVTYLSAEEKKRRSDQLGAQLQEARHSALEVFREIQDAGYAERTSRLGLNQGVTLHDVQSWCTQTSSLWLEYVIGQKGSYVVVIEPPAGARPQIIKLQLTADLAKRFGVDIGIAKTFDLTEAILREILVKEDGSGVLPQLNDPVAALQLTSRLNGLYELLIPAAIRPLLTATSSNKAQRVVIVPHGSLALLPFEVLVTDNSKSPVYLLDQAPPVVYGPSAAVFLYLVKKPVAGGGATSVLSLGDPDYDSGTSDTARNVVAQRSRFVKSRGSLARLKFSARESSWISRVFSDGGFSVTQLQGANATEAKVRDGISGKEIVHLACHGLVEQEFGNLFGALAVTPSANASLDPGDDGFLTLAETYELDLKACELAILSACETNFGPQQNGDGVWAMSRGFLVAGARRVVASDWLVDDEAAASLMSYFCGGIALSKQRAQTVDYAERLFRAKKWVRDQEKWRSPYYWGTFVLVGPN